MSQDLRAQLSAYLDGELPADERAEVQAGLERDPALARELEELRGLAADIAQLPVPRPPPSLLAGILSRVEGMAASERIESDSRLPSVPAPAPVRTPEPQGPVLHDVPDDLDAANDGSFWSRWSGPLIGLCAAALVISVGWNFSGRNAAMSPPPPSVLVAAESGPSGGAVLAPAELDAVADARPAEQPATGGEGAAPLPKDAPARSGRARKPQERYSPYAPEWERADGEREVDTGRSDKLDGVAAADAAPPAEEAQDRGYPRARVQLTEEGAPLAAPPSAPFDDGAGLGGGSMSLTDESEKKSANTGVRRESTLAAAPAPTQPASATSASSGPMVAAKSAEAPEPQQSPASRSPAADADDQARATLSTELGDALGVLRGRVEARGWVFRVVRGGGSPLSASNPRQEVDIEFPYAQQDTLRADLAAMGRASMGGVTAGPGGRASVRVVLSWSGGS